MFNPRFFVLPPLDEESVCRLPPRCGWQCWLQEHLLRHHTRRGEGGVNGCGDKKENKRDECVSLSALLTQAVLVLLLFVFLPPFPSSLLLSSTYSLHLSKDLSRWGWIGRVERLMTTVSVKWGHRIVFNKMNMISISLTYSLFLSVSHSLPTTTSLSLQSSMHESCCILRCCLEGWNEGIYSFGLKYLSR